MAYLGIKRLRPILLKQCHEVPAYLGKVISQSCGLFWHKEVATYLGKAMSHEVPAYLGKVMSHKEAAAYLGKVMLHKEVILANCHITKVERAAYLGKEM